MSRRAGLLVLALVLGLAGSSCSVVGPSRDAAGREVPDAAGDSASAADDTASKGDDAGKARPVPRGFAQTPLGNDSDAKARLVDLHVDRADGVERLMFTFADTRVLPKYHAAYVRAVRPNPEDDPIVVAGNAFLQVDFSLTNPNTRGRMQVPADVQPDQPVVKEVLLAENLGGSLGFAVGLDERLPFRVRELTDPTRLLVEVWTG